MTWQWWLMVIGFAIAIALVATWTDLCPGLGPTAWSAPFCQARGR